MDRGPLTQCALSNRKDSDAANTPLGCLVFPRDEAPNEAQAYLSLLQALVVQHPQGVIR